MKKAVVIVADTHINSVFGLSAPTVINDRGTGYTPNKLQMWLYGKFMAFATNVAALKEQGYYIVLVLNGDIVDMNKKAHDELVNLNPVYAKRHAVEVLKPLVDLADVRYMTKGTPTHVGDNASFEEDLAQLLGMEFDAERNEYTRWNLKLMVEDVLFNIAHHGSVGGQAWTATNSLLRYGTNLLVEHVRRGECVPDIVVRSDKHVYLDTHNTLPTRIIQGPCWQFPNDYVHKMKIERQATFGGLIFEVEHNGSYVLREDTFYELDPEQYNPTVIITD